ncbi:MAG: hypothetical protein ACRC4M_03050 [Mycoplasma sp.]
MKKNKNVIYITDILPCLNTNTFFKKEMSKLFNVTYFDWNLIPDADKSFKLETLVAHLSDFLDKHIIEDTTIILNGLSASIFLHIHRNYKRYINKLIIINPFGNMSHTQFFNLKSKMLPGSIKATINKYIYLFHSLDNFRENNEWLKAIRKEKDEMDNSQLNYHKILDQIIPYIEITKYLRWIKQLKFDTYFIVGESNPLIDINDVANLIQNTKLLVIRNSGYCIEWEQPESLLGVVKEILDN